MAGEGLLEPGKAFGEWGTLGAGHAVEGLQEDAVAPRADVGQMLTAWAGHVEQYFAAAVGRAVVR